jgi:hypothetical protein
LSAAQLCNENRKYESTSESTETNLSKMTNRRESLSERLKKLNDKFLSVGQAPDLIQGHSIEPLDSVARNNPPLSTKITHITQNQADDTPSRIQEEDETTDDEGANEENSPIITGRCLISPTEKLDSCDEEETSSQGSPIIRVALDRDGTEGEIQFLLHL